MIEPLSDQINRYTKDQSKMKKTKIIINRNNTSTLTLQFLIQLLLTMRTVRGAKCRRNFEYTYKRNFYDERTSDYFVDLAFKYTTTASQIIVLCNYL